MEKTRGKTTKDVKQLKSKLETLLNSPAMVEIGKILENIRKISEERVESAEKEPGDRVPAVKDFPTSERW
jgi:hypothetical protein